MYVRMHTHTHTHTHTHIYTRAGPFRFVDTYGARNLLDKINQFRERYGNQFDPAPMLVDYAKDPSKKFHRS